MRNTKIYISLLLLMVVTIGLGQKNNNIDSLSNAVRAVESDSLKIVHMLTLSLEYGRSNLDSAEWYAKNALDLSKKINSQYSICTSLKDLGTIVALKGNAKTSLLLNEEALVIAKELGDSVIMADCINHIGSAYLDLGDYANSTKYYVQALKIRELLNDSTAIASSYHNLGRIYAQQLDYNKSIESLKKAVAIWSVQGETSRVSKSYNNMAIVYKYKEEYDSARYYYYKSLDLKIELGDEHGKATLLNNIGSSYLPDSKYYRALTYYQLALPIAEKIGAEHRLALITYNMGICYLNIGELQKAELFADRSLKTEHRSQLASSYRLLSYVHTAKRDFQRAKHFKDLHIKLYDSLHNSKIDKQIAEIEIKYETEKKEQELIIQEKENLALAQNLTIRNLIILIVLLVVVAILIVYRYKSKLMLRNIDAKNRELAFAAIRMNKVNETINHVKKEINSKEFDDKTILDKILKVLPNNSEKDWNNLRLHFEQVHPNFFKKLQKKFNNISQNELKLCAYIKVNLSNKEIANILNVTPQSVKMSKYRLKKKFGLDEKKDLNRYVAVM